MDGKVAYSGPLAALSAVAFVAAVAMAWLSHNLAVTANVRTSRDGEVEADMVRQIAEKAGADESNLEAFRSRVERFHKLLGSQGTWESLVHLFEPGWAAEAGPVREKDGYSVKWGRLTRRSSEIADWPEILNELRNAELIAGVSIVGFEMRTVGSGDRRTVNLVQIDVEVDSRGPETESAHS